MRQKCGLYNGQAYHAHHDEAKLLGALLVIVPAGGLDVSDDLSGGLSLSCPHGDFQIAHAGIFNFRGLRLALFSVWAFCMIDQCVRVACAVTTVVVLEDDVGGVVTLMAGVGTCDTSTLGLAAPFCLPVGGSRFRGLGCLATALCAGGPTQQH